VWCSARPSTATGRGRTCTCTRKRAGSEERAGQTKRLPSETESELQLEPEGSTGRSEGRSSPAIQPQRGLGTGTCPQGLVQAGIVAVAVADWPSPCRQVGRVGAGAGVKCTWEACSSSKCCLALPVAGPPTLPQSTMCPSLPAAHSPGAAAHQLLPRAHRCGCDEHCEAPLHLLAEAERGVDI